MILHSTSYSFGLRKILHHLDSNGIEYENNSPHVGRTSVQHGIRVPLPDGKHYLSVQTHIRIVGSAIAEALLHTMIKNGIRLVKSEKLGYDGNEAIKFNELNDIIFHIEDCIKEYPMIDVCSILN